MAIVWLDSGIIGLIANPHKQREAEACERWLLGLAAKGVYLVSSSLCDYEVRRNLTRFHGIPLFPRSKEGMDSGAMTN